MALNDQRRRATAEIYAARARRISEVATNVPSLLDFERTYREVVNRGPEPLCGESDTTVLPGGGGKNLLHGIATVLLHSARPELISSELAELLVASGCAISAQVVSRSEDGDERVLRRAGHEAEGLAGTPGTSRRFAIGKVDDRTIAIVARPQDDFESAATLNLFPLFIEWIRDLEELRLIKERRSTLWPVEEPADQDQNAVISGHMRSILTTAGRVARTGVHVLITGESGTGKEIVARAIHSLSDRAKKPFVAFNCAAIPRDLAESQLFGYRRGAFTGADRDQIGLIRAAGGGTLFLDEIGELSPDLQPKLLRFLESGEISPLGERSFVVDVRIVAATNANLEAAVREGRFREDLFYRLNVVHLPIKPLRERRDEIPGMIHHFVAAAAREFGKGHLQVSEETMERLLLYRWPGNVRQLLNEVRRIVALAESNSTIEPEAISPNILGALPDLRFASAERPALAVPLTDKLAPTIARVECEMIKAALRENQGKVDAAARALGISRKGLYLKRQRLGL
jgi:DNA-binding NtrC family response regulator